MGGGGVSYERGTPVGPAQTQPRWGCIYGDCAGSNKRSLCWKRETVWVVRVGGHDEDLRTWHFTHVCSVAIHIRIQHYTLHIQPE